MSDLAYIDKYFKKELTTGEITEFERKIGEDPVFAEEVAFYCSTMQALTDQTAEEKKQQFRKIYDEVKSRDRSKHVVVRRLWVYIAAAAVFAGVIIGWYLLASPPSIQDLADSYIDENLVQMNVTMAGNQDSLEAAIRLYNEDSLPQALQRFEKLMPSDSTSGTSKKMAGIVYLRLGDYDKAIDYFTQYEKLNLYSNPGKLYHALALIKRNRIGDKETVKQLLQQVIEKDLEGKETAQKWLKSL